MRVLLELFLHYLLFMAHPKRSYRIYSTLKKLPESFVLSFEIESTNEKLLILKRSGRVWNVLRRPSDFPAHPSWVLCFRSPAVLRQILMLELPLHKAFIERKVSLRGNIENTLFVLKLFELLMAYALPWNFIVSRLTRETQAAPKIKAAHMGLQFLAAAPFQIWKSEREIL
jgi:hypothetical protein